MEESNQDIHPHCLSCIKFQKCSEKPKAGESCAIISCPSECGLKFHACKLNEHKYLCSNEKVPCINAEYGCPAILFRKNCSKHLVSCPASIIHCWEEWDRWPIHLHDKKTSQSSNQLDPVVRNHLDVALAMRDQRMLRRWCVAAAQGQTESHHKFKISTASSLWVFKKWQNSKEFSYPPGLEESVCKELCKACSKGAPNSPSNALSFSISNGYHTYNLMNTEIIDSSETFNKENSGDCNNKQMERRESIGKQKEEKSKTQSFEKPDVTGDLPLYNLDDVLQLSQFGTIVYHKSCREGSIYVAVDPAESFSYCWNGRKNVACQILDLKFRNPSSTPPWCLSLGLDLNLEARSNHPPSNFMYTFLCCQEFRRDEYSCHYKNVHCEIQGGLSGWLVERCPLAQYGCKFARRRFNPTPKESHIVYNEALESFGVAHSASETQESNKLNGTSSKEGESNHQLNLVNLPFEILQHIVRFLDSFSLSNLSLTSPFLRDVCSTVLKDRGLVHLKWEKHKNKDGTHAWRVSKYKRWFFSSHFTPIRSWTMSADNNMADHLRTCPFFNRTTQRKAFRYDRDSSSAAHAHDKRFCDPAEDTTTKL